MAYNDLIQRSQTQPLVPEQVSQAILAGAVTQSAALSLFRHLPMSSNQTRMPVLAALPSAYFVNGDTGLKQTTTVEWDNKYLNVEEIAVIVPIPEAVLDDAGFDVFGAVRPLLEEAIGRTLDAAIFFGTNKPASWPDAIVPAATAADNVQARGDHAAEAGGLAADISALFGMIEGDGYDVGAAIANRVYRGLLRDVRDSTGQRLPEVNPTSAYGVPITYPMRGMWPTGAAAAEFIAGDFSQGILGVRQDLTYKILDQAVITDAAGDVQYNLAQQDMVALRVVARFAWQVANVLNRDQPTEADRYPFGIMTA